VFVFVCGAEAVPVGRGDAKGCAGDWPCVDCRALPQWLFACELACTSDSVWHSVWQCPTYGMVHWSFSWHTSKNTHTNKHAHACTTHTHMHAPARAHTHPNVRAHKSKITKHTTLDAHARTCCCAFVSLRRAAVLSRLNGKVRWSTAPANGSAESAVGDPEDAKLVVCCTAGVVLYSCMSSINCTNGCAEPAVGDPGNARLDGAELGAHGRSADVFRRSLLRELRPPLSALPSGGNAPQLSRAAEQKCHTGAKPTLCCARASTVFSACRSRRAP